MSRTLVLAIAAFLLTAPLLAQEVAVHHELSDLELDDMVVRGTIAITVVNLSDEDLKNVDLRSDGAVSISKGVAQFGPIPGGEARVVEVSFLMPGEAFESSTSLAWTVNFDDAVGNHHHRDAFSTEPSE